MCDRTFSTWSVQCPAAGDFGGARSIYLFQSAADCSHWTMGSLASKSSESLSILLRCLCSLAGGSEGTLQGTRPRSIDSSPTHIWPRCTARTVQQVAARSIALAQVHGSRGTVQHHWRAHTAVVATLPSHIVHRWLHSNIHSLGLLPPGKLIALAGTARAGLRLTGD